MSTPLNNLCELIVDCPHSTAPDEGEGYPLIRTPNIGPGYLDLTDVHRVSKETYDIRNARAVPQPMDLILAREAPAGNVGIIRENQWVCLGQRTVLIRPDQNKVDPWFLNYYLNAPRQRHRLLSNANGATVSHINMPIIRNLPVDMPSMNTQRRIASILMAYDNLIENNHRQIALLEKSANLIYGEWLAGCDDSSFKTGVMSDFFDVTIGKTPPRSQSECFVSEGIPWASVKDLGATNGAYISSTSECLTQDAVDSYNVKVKPAGTILLSFKLTIGRVAIAEQPIATNEAIAHFETDDDAVRLYTYEYLRNFDYDTLGSTSSIGKAINSNIVKSIPFFMPDADSLDRFHSQLNPVFRLMRYCQRRVALLSESRNLLLLKLMSGEIEV